MSIRSAILALGPTVYWPLDDTSGISAADASGNGHPGTYLSGSVQGVPGPEVGTLALGVLPAPAPGGGVQITGTNPIAGASPVSTLSGWFTSRSMTLNHNIWLYDGLSNSTGYGMTLDAGIPGVIRGGIGFDTSGFAITLGLWHNLVVTNSLGGVLHVYVDGLLKYTSIPFGINTISATNPLLAVSQEAGAIAHAAFWNTDLSPTQIATLPAGRVSPQEITVTGRALSDLDAIALTNMLQQLAAAATLSQTELDAILAAVRKTY